ncbi:MAG: xanthine dehydrogenase molybdopterin binding subunit [Rhodobacteraceae bacterium]|nr:xanthine dehydrogenase molybdopterin binding subunit [Paracoccaceae bacterium]
MSVAEPLPHDSALLHVTGQARYVDDLAAPPGALHLAFGLSSVARGRLVALDLAPVRAAPGVVLALAATDLPRPLAVSPGAGDEPLLATGAVHYAGQPLFLVAAESHRAARIAARRAGIEIAPEAAILTVEAAMAAGSRFEEGPRVWSRGDVEAAIAAAPRRVAGRIEMGGQEHFYLEGQVALALPGEGGDMAVAVSSQHPTEIQHKVAEALDLPLAAVRVEVRRMGGGFGGKESQANPLAVACALVARMTGRPARMRYDRDDDFTVTGKRHAFRIDYRAGVDGEGRILGLDIRQFALAGWSLDLTTGVADRAMLHADNAYWLPAVRIESHRLRTNHASATAFRGFGGPQGMLGAERVIDHIAHALGRDPLAVRRANFYRPPRPAGAGAGAGTGEGRLTPYGQEVEDFILHDLVDRLEAGADYRRRQAAIRAWNAGQPVLRRGLALTPVKFGISFTLTRLNQAGALVHVYEDGSIHLNHGGTEMGQGLFRKVAQVVARAFGVPVGRVRVSATDTAKVPNTSPTAASSGSDLNGMAAQAAAEAIRGRMAAFLAAEHQARPEDVVFALDRVRVGAAEMGFAEAARRAVEGRVGLSATGFYRTPGLHWDRIRGEGRPYHYFTYGAAACEVVIDTLTGEHRILRADLLHDCGQSLNPAIDLGQIEGAFVQGAGWLTSEELVWDEAGRLVTHAPSTYKIPACSDRPRIFNVALWDGPGRVGTIHHSKAVGEPPLMLAIAVLMALSDAVAAAGDGSIYPALDAPATPERVLAAVARVRGRGR